MIAAQTADTSRAAVTEYNLFCMKLTPAQIRLFQKTIYDFYAQHGRHDLPWRTGKVTPYSTFVSEVMLQQTQVPRVISKYKEWMRAFPSWRSLATAELREVLQVWQGMGYNRRGKWLQESAKLIIEKHKGRLPSDPAELISFPGIGPNTAASIAAFGFDQPTVFIETNIRSVIIHHFFADKEGISDADILPLVKQTLDRAQPHRWYSAIMDYGTQLKADNSNPSRRSRHHTKQSKFEGSLRQIRGAILKSLAHGGRKTAAQLTKEAGFTKERVEQAAAGLRKDGMLQLTDKQFFI